MFLLFTLTIVLLTALLPFFVARLTSLVPRISIHKSYSWLPAVAAILYITAWLIPDIHISDQTTTFQQHFVGGGMYLACLYVYFKKLLGWKLSPYISLVILFAWVSAFGVANELFELTLNITGLTQVNMGDTGWDLLANTLGAFVAYAVLVLIRLEK